MYRYAAIITLIEVVISAPSPLRLTINCGSNERENSILGSVRRSKSESQDNGSFDVNSFCSLIHNAIPKAVRDGKFVVVESDMDQQGFSDTQVPLSLPPPNGFIPKLGLPRLRKPKLRIPTINVPKLSLPVDRPLVAPRLGSPMTFKTYRDYEEPTSAEKMEQFKKGVQKMLHFVKVLGQVDQYLTERTRIVIDKLSKTFAE